MTEFADHLKSKAEMDNCLVCQSPTRSHIVLLTFDPETGNMVAVDELDDADGFGTCCHGCYETADGDADAVAQQYNERLDAVLEYVGVDKEQLAKDPEAAAGYTYECDECGEHVTAAEITDHQGEHDGPDVGFSRIDNEGE